MPDAASPTPVSIHVNMNTTSYLLICIIFKTAKPDHGGPLGRGWFWYGSKYPELGPWKAALPSCFVDHLAATRCLVVDWTLALGLGWCGLGIAMIFKAGPCCHYARAPLLSRPGPAAAASGSSWLRPGLTACHIRVPLLPCPGFHVCIQVPLLLRPGPNGCVRIPLLPRPGPIPAMSGPQWLHPGPTAATSGSQWLRPGPTAATSGSSWLHLGATPATSGSTPGLAPHLAFKSL